MRPYQYERVKNDRSLGTMSARTRKAFARAKPVRRGAPAAKGPSWLWLLLLGGGAYALLKSNKASAATTPAVSAPAGPVNPGLLLNSLLPIQAGTVNIPELPGSFAVSAPEVSGSASFWDTLLSGPSLPAGYVNFPSGSQAAATLFQTHYDTYGSAYVQWGGLTYILTGPDSSGNYTATRVMTGSN